MVKNHYEENTSLYDIIKKKDQELTLSAEKISRLNRIIRKFKKMAHSLKEFIIKNNGIESLDEIEHLKEDNTQTIPENNEIENKEQETDPPEGNECVICQERKRTYAIIPCGHYCCCEECVTQLKGICPVCRDNFLTTCRIFQ